MPEPLVSHQSVLLSDGKVLMLGGRESTSRAPHLFVGTYDPRTDTWK